MRQFLIYSTVVLASFGLTGAVQAQSILTGQTTGVAYTDITPDKTVAVLQTGYAMDSLDLDADGRYDLLISVGLEPQYPSSASSIVRRMHNDVALYADAYNNFAEGFPQNFNIQATIQWPIRPNSQWGGQSITSQFSGSFLTTNYRNPAGTSAAGAWLGSQDTYLAVRVRNNPGGAWRYGWVRIQVDNRPYASVVVSIKDYALTNMVLAQTSAMAAGWKVYPMPVKAWISIKSPTPISGHLMVVDALGKERLSVPFSPANFQFDLSGLPAGVYFMRLKTAYETFTERIVKQ